MYVLLSNLTFKLFNDQFVLIFCPVAERIFSWGDGEVGVLSGESFDRYVHEGNL